MSPVELNAFYQAEHQRLDLEQRKGALVLAEDAPLRHDFARRLFRAVLRHPSRCS